MYRFDIAALLANWCLRKATVDRLPLTPQMLYLKKLLTADEITLIDVVGHYWNSVFNTSFKGLESPSLML